MDLSLGRWTSRVLLVAAAVACASLIGVVAGRRWLAAHWAGSRNPAEWLRAAQLEPEDAGYWRQLGLYQEWDFEHGDIQRAIAYFKRTTEIDPHSDLYWTDLATAYETAGEIARAREAYRQALAAHPDSADVAWRYGSFLLRQGDEEEAARQVHRALVDEPELAPSAVAQFWGSGVKVDRILNAVLPAREKDDQAAVDYFVGREEDDAALAAWNKLAGLGASFPLIRSFDLIDSLIGHNRFEDAAGVWKEALAAAGRKDAPGSLIFNGGFESDPVNGGFGWRETPANGALMYLVTDVTHGGARSMRITFDGTANVDYANLRQYLALDPGRRYRFSAYMRTDSITTDSGPHFVIADPGNLETTLAETPVMTGTHPWTLETAEFTAGPDQHGALVMLRRASSNMFDNKIRGTLWIDDVRLTEIPPAAGAKQ